MSLFEITIRRKDNDAWPVVVRHQPDAGALVQWSRGWLDLDLARLELLRPTEKPYGEQLGQALFRDIRDAFVRAMAGAEGGDERLRVLLIVEADDLRDKHWEQLCAPLDRGWDYLLLNQQTPFSLYLPSQIERHFPPIGRRDLRALILVAGPEDLDEDHGLASFDVAATVNSLRQALGQIPCDVLARVEGASGPPRLDTLCKQVTAGADGEAYTLLHLVCHGTYHQATGETLLYFPEDEGLRPVPASMLIERLSRLRRLPHLAFLSTCESADPQAETGLGGLGQRLVRELGMPAVVAMTDRISVETAEALASDFYARLRESGEVDCALSAALVGLQGRADVTVPALFSRLESGRLFVEEEAVVPPVEILLPPPEALQWFVDRERERERFDKMLAGDDKTRVLAVSGPAGIGKTQLCTELYVKARAQPVPAFPLNFEWGAAYDELLILVLAAQALGRQYSPRLSRKLEEAARHGVLTTGAGNADVRRLWVPGLTGAFLQDLTRLGQEGGEGVLLLFDSYDRATKEARDWVEEQLLPRVCTSALPRMWVVMAGEELPRLSARWGGLVADLSLKPWDAEVVRTYLRGPRTMVISEASVATIYRVTGGRPDQVALVADFKDKVREPLDEEQVQEILARGIVEYTKGPVRETLRRAALPEWFDRTLLAALLEAPQEVDERLDELRPYSFVRGPVSGRYSLAPPARQVLLETWEREPEELARLHARAASHFDERALGEAEPSRHAELERQAMGHWLAADEDTGWERLCALFEEQEQGFWLSECELLINRAEAVPGLGESMQVWLDYLRARLAFARRDPKSRGKWREVVQHQFETVRDKAEPGSELYALAEWSLGQVAAEAGNWDETTDHYDKSLQTFVARKDAARQGQVLVSLGEVHLEQAKALGGLMQPRLLERGRGRSWMRALPAAVVVLPFVVYARAIRHWRLPPLQYGMSYTNWTLARLLLNARQWFREADACLQSAGKEDLRPDAQRKLAQTYHLLGWEGDAQELLRSLLKSEPVSSSDYRTAQVWKDLAESEIAAGEPGEAIKKLRQCLQTFHKHEDVQAQAETRALLGRAYLEQDNLDQGLPLLRESLAAFAGLGDHLGAGVALHALHAWLQHSPPAAEHVTEVQAVLADARDKVYFPRVADRSAQAVELIASAGLLVLLVAGLLLIGFGVLTPVDEYLSRAMLLRLGIALLLSPWIVLGLLGGLGLLLIVLGARREPRAEPLAQIVTGAEAVRRFDYQGNEQARIPWGEVQAVVSVNRVLWRSPLALLSQLQIFGREGPPLRVPATVRWYGALRQDVEDHLRDLEIGPARLRLDARLPLGPVLLLSLALLALGDLVVYAKIPLPASPQVTAGLGTALLFLGVMALLLVSAWWLVIHPLWVRYHLKPRSWLPLAAGLAGLGIAAVGWWQRSQHPFHPLRNWLEFTVYPLGYVLLAAAFLWVLTARHRRALGQQCDGPACSRWLRAAAVPLFLATVALFGQFVYREWLPYWYLYRGLACRQAGDPDCTTQSAQQALDINPDMVDGWYLLAAGAAGKQDYAAAVGYLTHIIESDSERWAEYYLRRALLYKELDEIKAACDDLRTALDARRWGLSAGRRVLAQEKWGTWECDGILDQGKE